MFFFFNDTATTEIYTLSLHDALPISVVWHSCRGTRPTHQRNPNPPDQEASRRRTGGGCRSPSRQSHHGQDDHRAQDQHRSEEHTSELQSPCNLVCRLLLEKKKQHDGIYYTVKEWLSLPGLARTPLNHAYVILMYCSTYTTTKRRARRSPTQVTIQITSLQT